MDTSPQINIHTHHSTNLPADVVNIVNMYPSETAILETQNQSWYSVGLHPWHISEESLANDYENVLSASKQKKVIAIGETGLDRLTKAPLNLQKKVFEFHLKLAASLNKPLIVHAVRTYPDIVEIYKKLNLDVKLIFHGFRGNQQIATQLIKHGFYLSFGESLMSPNKKACQMFKAIPLENIFLETDESALSIGQIYEKAAHIRKITSRELNKSIFENFLTCFGNIL